MYSPAYDSMRGFLEAASAAGFTHIDLNNLLTGELLDELLESGGFKISTLHAPIPNPFLSGGGRLSELSLSSEDRQERKEAVRGVLETIETAASLNTKTVVLHAGDYDIDTDLEKQLRRSCLEGLKEAPRQGALRKELIRTREEQAARCFRFAEDSLSRITEYAEKKDISIALETRANFHEIPDPDEMSRLLEKFPPERVSYWHDTGHAEFRAREGFTPHLEWFERFRDRLSGVHLHDMKELKDHFPPGEGDLDWELISRNLPEGIIKVCEIGRWHSFARMAASIPFLKSRGILNRDPGLH